jgi:hypothetical protein
MPHRGRWAALGAAVIGIFGLAGTAQAAATGGEFVCRSSAARVVTLGNPPLATVEPVRANVNGTPCASGQNAETVKPTTIGPITADAVRAYTTYTPGTNPAVGADAIVTAPRIVLGGLSIGVDAIEAHASATCTSATTPPTLASSSKVVNLTINGNTIAIPGNSQPFVLNLSPLIKISLNEKVTSVAGIVTQRAVHITTLGNDIVIGEAIAGTATGTPCAGVTPPGPGPCPTGSTYDAARNACVIVTSTGKVIVVGYPFQNGNGHIGTANGPLATCGRLKKVAFTQGRKTTLTQGYRRHDRVVIRGVLMTCGSHPKPIVGAQMDVVHIIRGVRYVVKTGVKTRPRGRFTLIEPRNIRTRIIEFAYRGNLNTAKVSSRVRLRYTLIGRRGRVLR